MPPLGRLLMPPYHHPVVKPWMRQYMFDQMRSPDQDADGEEINFALAIENRIKINELIQEIVGWGRAALPIAEVPPVADRIPPPPAAAPPAADRIPPPPAAGSGPPSDLFISGGSRRRKTRRKHYKKSRTHKRRRRSRKSRQRGGGPVGSIQDLLFKMQTLFR